MKPFSKQTNKWLLSTLLIAALGSQYYFSVSSKSLGSTEMSSTASEEKLARLKLELDSNHEASPEVKVKRIKELDAEFAPKIAAEKLAGQSLGPQKIEQLAAAKTEKIVLEPVVAKSETEGKTVQIFCADCGTSGISVTGSEDAIKAIAVRLSTKKEEKIEPAVAKVEVKEEVVIETAAEKRERLKQEKEDKKQAIKDKKEEIKQAKLDKINEAKSERNDLFAEKAEEMADKCKDDLDCKVKGLSSLMTTYSGNRKVDLFVVTKAYNQYIDKDLKAGLSAAPGTEAHVAALEAIYPMMAIPSEYKSLKTRTIEYTKAGQNVTANSINEAYKRATVLGEQKKSIESYNVRDQAIQAEQLFKSDYDYIKSNIYEGLSSSKDQTTMAYVTSNYLTDINKIVTRLSNAAGITDTVTTVTAGGRAGRTGNGTILNGNPVQSNADILSGVKFGTATTNRVGTRQGQ